MRSESAIVHQCHGDAICEFHAGLGSVVLPCSPGSSLFFPATVSTKLSDAIGYVPSGSELEAADNLTNRTLEFEAWMVRDALRRTNGHIGRAATLLGLASRQALDFILDGRLKHLRPRPKERHGDAKRFARGTKGAKS